MSAEQRERFGLTPKLLSVFCAAALSVNAWGQDQDDEDEAAELDRVVVTGSLIQREDFVSTSPVQIVNAEEQAQVGQLTLAEILQGTTIAAGVTQQANQFGGFVNQGGAGVQTLNLRGLGTNRTLILLNGRRPGGSGTRGETFAVDLSFLPEIAVQRAELLLDGSSSIYGSDAVAGVANVITRRDVDGLEVQGIAEITEDGGGELYRAGLINGWNFGSGNIMFSAQWEKREALRLRDRDFLNCERDLVRDADGNLIDREDRSVTAGTPLGGCLNYYVNTVIGAGGGDRWVPAPDGVTSGPISGYRPRANGRYDDGDGEPAFYEDVLNTDFFGSTMAFNETERINVYSTGDFNFDFWGGVDWDYEFLYSHRETNVERWRQFFPLVSSPRDFIFGGYANDPDYDHGFVEGAPLGLVQPVIPYPSNSSAEIDYFYVTTGLSGLLPTENYWSWQAFASYSYSDGDYGNNAILNSLSGDVRFDPNAPQVNYFDPSILSGANQQPLIDAVGVNILGNTVYDQFQATAIVSGDLFSLPAGILGAAFGLEYRYFSIDDQPSQAAQDADLWGQSSALVTKGDNDVIEAFAEFEIPLLAGIPGIEELTLNVSARAFDYDVGGNDWVWKTGLRWQIVPSLMARATAGTSFRAPALFELFLGDQTGFVATGVDPCIDWGESNNENIRRNCAAEGIPEDYAGAASTPLLREGGGAGTLEPETSDAFTLGLVWTPEFTDLSVAVDYIDLTVNDEITTLTPGAILGGCYNSQNFPNSFCDFFERNGPDAAFPFDITEINATFINVNEQTYKGVDLNVLWNIDVDWGLIELALQSTWNLENVQRTFDPNEVEGFDIIDQVGTIGFPENATNFRATFNWEDWRFNYFMQYVSETDDDVFFDDLDDPDDNPRETTYFGFDPAFLDLTMDQVFYHNLSVIYQQDNWDILFGINNLLDEEPDVVSAGVRNPVGLAGNVPVAATSQYDIFGRRYFLRFNWRM